MKEIHPIHFDVADLAGVLRSLQSRGNVYSAVFALVDDGIPAAVRRSFLGALDENHVMVIRGGESAKTIRSVGSVWEFLLRTRADRNALLVNLGGGAVCDAGGFAASTYKRGIDFVHVPSTLLSMVDASVGGKTGINMGGIKNTVGTFAMPAAVFIYRDLLHSLPEREMFSGYAEMVKHGLIANSVHLENVLAEFSQKHVPSLKIITDSIEIKSAIVGRDPQEKGERKMLNFGHTVGHGLESYFAEIPGKEILHGEAVAAGMISEMFISSRLLGFPEARLRQFREILAPLTVHIQIKKDMIEPIMDKIKNDKKNEGPEIGVTLLNEKGRGEWGRTVSEKQIREALEFLILNG